MPLETRVAGLALEAAAGTSHHESATKKRGLSLAQCPCLSRGPNATSAARCAHTASSSAALPTGDGERWRACAA